MVEAYNKAREKFLMELRFIFPNSNNLILEVNVDNIAQEDFKVVPAPHKEESLADGVIKWKSATVGSEEFTDTFNTEYL